MKVNSIVGSEDVAQVYIIEFEGGRLAECVESIQPPLPREKKWVLLVSTLCGCPVGCSMCDAGGFYRGKLSTAEILAQIEFLVNKRFPDRAIPAENFKIQFARMGEPALNPAVLEVLEELPDLYAAPGLMPSLSTIAPASASSFMDRLLGIKQTYYRSGRFQFQFSLHTTDARLRDQLIPVKKWGFAEMAAYGDRFYQPGDRKITLNFALAQGYPLETAVLTRYFNPAKFLIKITPLNPTYRAQEHGLSSQVELDHQQEDVEVIRSLQEAGYQVILSIGEPEENLIGSNCGQYVLRHMQASAPLAEGYTYPLEHLLEEGLAQK